MGNTNQPHHNTPWYKKTAPAIRRAAYANPNHRCPHCTLTLTEMRQLRPNNVIGWDAGHIVDGNESYGLQAECSFCNRSRGAKARNRKGPPKPTTSRNWGQT